MTAADTTEDRVATLHSLLNDAAKKVGEQREMIKALEAALVAVNGELWWCAIQLGCDWKDKTWRKRSSVARAYDRAVAVRERTKVESQAQTTTE